jgi:hypothetical protein
LFNGLLNDYIHLKMPVQIAGLQIQPPQMLYRSVQVAGTPTSIAKICGPQASPNNRRSTLASTSLPANAYRLQCQLTSLPYRHLSLLLRTIHALHGCGPRCIVGIPAKRKSTVGLKSSLSGVETFPRRRL